MVSIMIYYLRFFRPNQKDKDARKAQKQSAKPPDAPRKPSVGLPYVQGLSEETKDKCDRFEQKQACGCILTNPPRVTPLRPGSTVIDGFSKLIPQRIAVEISYRLVYCYQ